MSAPYRELLQQIREFFPKPVADPMHGAYFVFSILRALDKVDAMKGAIPLLGGAVKLDYEAQRSARIAERPSSIDAVTSELVKTLEGMLISGHPGVQMNVVPPPSIASIIGALLPSIYNPNLVSDDTSQKVALAEHRVAAMAAALVGYDPALSRGVFTFGGTGTTLYGVRIGIEKALPGTRKRGIDKGGAIIFASELSHFCRLSVASWLGLGEDNVVEIPTGIDNDIKIDHLEKEMRTALKDGRRIAAIIATMGTTDAFGLDDLGAIVALRDRLVEEFRLDYRPHVHADAVIGWAWSVFNDYDFEENPLGFRPRTVRALNGACRRIRELSRADSVGIDFHKTGFAPYISSLFLLKDGSDFDRIARTRDRMPYLFQTGSYHPGTFTLETTRSGTGVMAALANLLLLGKDGLRSLLGHMVEIAEVLRENLDAHAATTVMNSGNVGTVTLFRAYPDGIDTWTVKDRERADPGYREKLMAHNEYNRKLHAFLHEEAMAGRGVLISMTDCYRTTDYGEPIVALKSFILSPFADGAVVELLVERLLEARESIR